MAAIPPRPPEPGAPPQQRAESWYLLGLHYEQEELYSEAAAAFQQAVHEQPALAVAWFGLGVALVRQGLGTEAQAAFRQANRLYEMGTASGHRDQYAEAIAAYNEALKREPEDAVIWRLLGLALERQGEHQEAIGALRETVRLEPDDAESWYRLGELYARQGDGRRVMECYEHLRRLSQPLSYEFCKKYVVR